MLLSLPQQGIAQAASAAQRNPSASTELLKSLLDLKKGNRIFVILPNPVKMDKFSKAFLAVLLYLWQLPQNLLGGILVLCYKAGAGQEYRGVRLHYSNTIRGGISLGRHIILNRLYQSDDAKNHEWGHTRQSLRLGWFYLFVIGIPSLLWACRHRENYYAYWTERWADRLGGVKRA